MNTPFLHALNAAIKPLQNYGVRVTCPPPARRYTGRRARRDAFYARQKLARLLARIVRVVPPDWHLSIERAKRDALVLGFCAVKIERLEPRHDIDPLTGGPWALPYRVRHITREEFYREYPKWPDDYCDPKP